MTDMFNSTGWECPQCGWAGYVTEEQHLAHRCYGYDMDVRKKQFLNRWMTRGANREAVARELDDLIAEARKP